MAGIEAVAPIPLEASQASPIKDEVPAEMPTEMNLVIVSMDKVLFEGKVKSMIAPGPYGNFAILPGHTPLFIKLVAGKIVVHSGNGNEEFEIDEGLAKITQNKIVILVGFQTT
jgi:F-type H+-transporting ATPase subunit epsilon